MSNNSRLMAAVIFALIFSSCELGGAFNPTGPHFNNIVLPAPAAPTVLASDGLITLHWKAVEGAENYEVYINTTQNPLALPEKTVPGTATVLDGLVNKTVYYLWIRAVSGTGISNLSPHSRAIPWPADEAPAVPQRPTVTPGVNQLTVSWEPSGGAQSYEVYINTRTTTPPLPEISTENTSAVIGNLVTDQIYYLWIRAVNSAGKSGFSLSEAGTPRIPTAAPPAPDRPILTAGSRELSVSWLPVELAAAYEVWAGTSNNAAAAQKQGSDIPGDRTEGVITGLINGSEYFVWVRAKNNIGISTFSPSERATPSAFAALPVTPAVPMIIPGSGQLTVTWPAAEGALLYELWHGLSDNPASAEKYGADISGTSVTLTGLVNNTTYYFWLKAKNSTGESGFSPVASGTPTVFTVLPLTPAAAPVVTAGNSQLTLSWQAVEGASSYEVWAGTANNSGTATKRGSDVSGFSTVITGLANGTMYYVWIKAKNNIGTSGFSPAASGTPSIDATPPQTPAAPVLAIGSGQLNVSWTAVSGTAAYEIWLGTTNNSASASQNGDDISTSLSASVSGLSNGTMYYIWLKAKNSSGTSGFSPVASGKPIANAAAPVLTAGNSSITLNWASIAGAEQYEVFYGTGINPPQTAAQTVNAPAASATLNGLVNGTSYNVWIRGKNSSGIGSISSSANAKPISSMGTVTLNAGNQQLSLTWPALAGADEYEVFYSASSTMPSSPAQTVSSAAATISGLTNGTMYYIWVRGKNANGTSNTSAPVSGAPLGTPGSPALTPGFRQLAVSWSAVPGADEYEVYFGIGSANTLVTVTAETSATISELTAGITYQVRLRAKNANGVSGFGLSANGVPNAGLSPGLYQGTEKIGEQNLATALSWISSNAVTGDDFIIVLGANETISPATLAYSNKTVGITLMGTGGERTVNLSSNGSMFTVNAGVTLTLDENVTLMGRSENNASLVTVNGATLVMNEGAGVKGNKVPPSVYGGYFAGAVHMNYGSFTMHGGTISENTARGDGGAIHMNPGSFTMHGGTINGNTAPGNGGAVYMNYGNFTMYGGTISGNTGGNGGGIFTELGGTIIINSGTISGNTGGGIYIRFGTAYMYGGTINGNNGGGITVNSGTFYKLPISEFGQNSGIIYGNEAIGIDEDGIQLRNTGHAVLKMFSNLSRNTTAWETDQIDTTTGKGLSASGNPPYGE